MTCIFRHIDQHIGNYYLQDLLLNIALDSKDIFFSISSVKTGKNLALAHYAFNNSNNRHCGSEHITGDPARNLSISNVRPTIKEIPCQARNDEQKHRPNNSNNRHCGLDPQSPAFKSNSPKSTNNISVDQLLYNLSQLRSKEKILSSSLSYKNVVYTILDYKATIIPKKYFNEKEQEKYISLLFSNNNNLTYFSEKIQQIKAVAVSAINPAYTTALSIPYPTAKYRSIYSILVQKIFAISEEKSYKRFSTQVLLHINSSTFELVVKKSNKLIFINTFPYERKSDILYYFLYALNKLGLDMGAIAVFLCGRAKDIDIIKDIKTQAYHTYYNDNYRFLLVL